jgi:hypothetical protein
LVLDKLDGALEGWLARDESYRARRFIETYFDDIGRHLRRGGSWADVAAIMKEVAQVEGLSLKELQTMKYVMGKRRRSAAKGAKDKGPEAGAAPSLPAPDNPEKPPRPAEGHWRTRTEKNFLDLPVDDL